MKGKNTLPWADKIALANKKRKRVRIQGLLDGVDAEIVKLELKIKEEGGDKKWITIENL